MALTRFFYSVFCILLFILSSSCVQEEQKKARFHQKKQIGLKPFEDFFLAKDYPELSPDIARFQQVADLELKRIEANRSSVSNPWGMEGPLNIGGRINTIAIHPSSLNTILIGTPNGGIFKTTDGGFTWQPVFDNEITSAIGDIEYAPSNPSIVFAGTGDPALGGYSYIGNGIYKSNDGGNTWLNSGLINTGVISKIQIHPTNPNIIYVACMGNKMERTMDRGIYKSIDGGGSWAQIKFIDQETGFNHIVLNPQNTSILYATSWRRVRNNTESIISGYTSRLYKSEDAGLTWNQLDNGLPNINLSKWNICISKQNPNKLYVSLVDSTLEFHSAYVSLNAGASFTPLQTNGLITPFNNSGWYMGEITINPSNDQDMLLGGVNIWRTQDGGNTFNLAAPEWFTYEVHADHHDVEWIDNNTFYLCTDGGLYKTTNSGSSYFHFKNLPINQFYRIAINPHIQNDYWAGAQDNGTTNGNAANAASWVRVFGGDGFQQRFNPLNSYELYTETQNGSLYSSTDGGVFWNYADNGIDPNDRRNWDMPYVMSSFNPNDLYTGTYRVYKNDNGPFANWTPISQDLTDGIIYGARFHTISAIDHASLITNKLLVGTSDANVWYSNNDGANWNDITSTLPNRYVTSVKFSPNQANTIYVTHSGYKSNSYIPHIHKSIDKGLNWIDISSNLPQFAINDLYIQIGNENILFVATDGGVYYSVTGGSSWLRLGNNMPMIPVYDLEYDAFNNKIIAGTFGRSMQSIELQGITSGLKPISDKNYLPIRLLRSSFQHELKIIADVTVKNALIKIYDVSGKLVYITERNLEVGENELLNLNFNKGNYILNVSDSKQTFVKKIFCN